MKETSNIIQEILNLIRSDLSKSKLRKALDHYHESDIADAVAFLSKEERQKLYEILGDKATSDIFAHLDDVEDYIEELDDDKAADILQEMDADDAIDVLQELDLNDRKQIVSKMEDEAKQDIKLIASYEEDEIGSKMTTNYIVIPHHSTIKQAMRIVVKNANENDNVNTIYVVEDDDTFFGCIELKDLIIARAETDINTIIHTNYPYLKDKDKVSDVINDLKEYDLVMIPVLDQQNHLIGVITSSDIVEAVDAELGEDYAKLAGLSKEEDVDEPYFRSLKKRLPWLGLLLILGLCVSMVISQFEAIIAIIPMVVFFQSIVLDMAGNVGTQSLAVTIRYLNSDEVTPKKTSKMIFKEVRLGFTNGIVIGGISFLIVLAFLFVKHQPITGETFLIHDALFLSSSVLIAMIAALTLASFVGVFIPVIFKKCKIDPAVASGPLITTIDDMVAVVTYYGLAMAFFNTLF